MKRIALLLAMFFALALPGNALASAYYEVEVLLGTSVEGGVGDILYDATGSLSAPQDSGLPAGSYFGTLALSYQINTYGTMPGYHQSAHWYGSVDAHLNGSMTKDDNTYLVDTGTSAYSEYLTNAYLGYGSMSYFLPEPIEDIWLGLVVPQIGNADFPLALPPGDQNPFGHLNLVSQDQFYLSGTLFVGLYEDPMPAIEDILDFIDDEFGYPVDALVHDALGVADLTQVLTADVDFGGSASIKAVPVPAAVWLLGSGLICLVGLRRKLS